MRGMVKMEINSYELYNVIFYSGLYLSVYWFLFRKSTDYKTLLNLTIRAGALITVVTASICFGIIVLKHDSGQTLAIGGTICFTLLIIPICGDLKTVLKN